MNDTDGSRTRNIAALQSTAARVFHRQGGAPRVRRASDALEAIVRAAGIEIGGSGPASVRILDDRVYDIALTRGFTGLRGAYVEGWWDAERLDVVTERMLLQDSAILLADPMTLALRYVWATICNPQSLASNAKARRHYDLGNDLYRAMLDRRMVYSCAYWRDARNLDEAQEAKLDMVCRKLRLEPRLRVLDIGCGWGSFAKFAAQRFGVSVVQPRELFVQNPHSDLNLRRRPGILVARSRRTEVLLTPSCFAIPRFDTPWLKSSFIS